MGNHSYFNKNIIWVHQEGERSFQWVGVSKRNCTKGQRISQVGISLVILPADNLHQISYKAWNFTFHQGKVSHYHIFIRGTSQILLVLQLKKSINQKKKECGNHGEWNGEGYFFCMNDKFKWICTTSLGKEDVFPHRLSTHQPSQNLPQNLEFHTWVTRNCPQWRMSYEPRWCNYVSPLQNKTKSGGGSIENLAIFTFSHQTITLPY